MTAFHQLTATSLGGELIPMADYAGKLVVVVLGFPCNQFGKQEAGGADDIAQTCHINYGVNFPMFGKVEVNGNATHPVFRYLKDALPGVLGRRIKWNLTKFLIGRDGEPLKRFAPFTLPRKWKPLSWLHLKAKGSCYLLVV